MELRRRILNAFEFAETTTDESLQEAALTFVVIGAGPTGVEMAGAISELAKRTLVDDFRNIRTKHARIDLLDAAPRVFPGFNATLSKSAEDQLKQLDIEVHAGTKVLNVTEEGVQLENEFLRARTVVWAAGNAASPLAKQLDAETDRQGRMIVGKTCVSRVILKYLQLETLPISRIKRGIRSQELRPLRCRWEHTPPGISWSSPKAENQIDLSIGTRAAWLLSGAIRRSRILR